MKLFAVLWVSFIWILISSICESISTSWNKLVTSKHYVNTKLVMESENPFQSLNISKGNPISSTRIVCSQFCANNATCLAFNFYSTDSHYVCEFLSENFCSNRQRIALQISPGGTVWDKLLPGMTKTCIDQQLENKTMNTSCDIGRSGCSKSSTVRELTGCNNCLKTCINCATFFKIPLGRRYDYNCTLWPEGPAEAPIFAFCFGTSTFVAKRRVNLSNGTVWPNYRMNLRDMHRISKLNAYTTFQIGFSAGSTGYVANYRNFYIRPDGALVNMIYKLSSGGDGFSIGSQALKPSPWIETNSSCGSFWLINSTLSTVSLQCPGGNVSLFGSVNINASPKQTGLRWPQATTANKILEYGEIKLS